MVVDCLRLLVEALSRVVPKALAQKKGKERNALGVELYSVYVAINEALIRGEQIIREVEQFVDDNGADPREARLRASRLADAVAEQINCLDRIGELMVRWGQVLQFLDGYVFAELFLQIGPKRTFLGSLLSVAQSTEFPVLDQTLLKRLERSLVASPDVAADDDEPTEQLSRFDAVMDAKLGLRGLRISSEADGVSEATRKEFRAYLENRKPREQLAGIRRQLEELRLALSRQFTVDDLLLTVADQVFSRPKRSDWWSA